ncbi:MAG: hypothetical protein Q7J84_18540 [Sulfuricaulis sp.]|nr:hypothetical protein [Sulfuricaulis sp.]
MSGPTDWVPESGFVPDHAPDPVHEVALDDDQVSVELASALTVKGLAESDTVGTTGVGEGVTPGGVDVGVDVDVGVGALLVKGVFVGVLLGGVDVGVAAAGFGELADAKFAAPPLAVSPAPPPQPDTNDAINKTLSDTELAIRGRSVASINCFIDILLLKFLPAPAYCPNRQTQHRCQFVSGTNREFRQSSWRKTATLREKTTQSNAISKHLADFRGFNADEWSCADRAAPP